MAPRACILAPLGQRLSASERAFFAEADPWGFILFTRNIKDPAQLSDLTAELRDTLGRNAPVLIDQEGGRVQRMGPPHWRQWLPPLDHVDRAGADAPRALWLRSRLIAQELHAAGIDVNCAPCADIARPETHPFLQNRCHGRSAEEVARNAAAVAEGLMAGGVLPVMKHLPGHGRGTKDSHLDLPVVHADRAALAADMAPFRALAGLPMAMTAHLVYKAIDDRPATQSPAAIRLIRDEIGFEGLLMTDDISMQALGGPVGQRGALALAAGCDLVLHCNGEMDEMEEIAAISPELAGPSLTRAEAALAARRAPEPGDPAAWAAELDALLRDG